MSIDFSPSNDIRSLEEIDEEILYVQRSLNDVLVQKQDLEEWRKLLVVERINSGYKTNAYRIRNATKLSNYQNERIVKKAQQRIAEDRRLEKAENDS